MASFSLHHVSIIKAAAALVCLISMIELSEALPRFRMLGLPRIVGGEDAQPGHFPWQLSLQRYDSHMCGASIVNQEWAITAAHCAAAASELSIVCGCTDISRPLSSECRRVYVSDFIVHNKYNPKTLEYDVAMVKFTECLPLNQENIAAIHLAPANPTDDYAGRVSTITGWGTTKESGSLSPKLQFVQIPIITNWECNECYPEYPVTDTMVCAGYPQGGKDSCQGDSGGPLVVDNKLVGIVSWGVGCARPDNPGVYSYVPASLDWIETTMSEKSSLNCPA